MTGAEPAFPEVHISHWKANDPEMGPADHVLPRWRGGLTKREYFAAMAMQGMAGVWFQKDGGSVDALKNQAIVERAAQLADALIAELSK